MTNWSRLYNIPTALPMESPSSWVTRAALMQGASVGALLDHLNIEKRGDVDLHVVRSNQARLRAQCNLPPEHLDLSARLLFNLLKSGSKRSRFLLSVTKRRKPRYRYCAPCFREQMVPHLPIHWRFSAFRYCPIHQCMLEDQCSSCGAEVIMPISQITAGPKHGGVAYLSQCMSCGADLSKAPVLGTSEAFSVLKQSEREVMRNGRATLSSLLQGRLFTSDWSSEQSLEALHLLDMQDLLPNDVTWMTISVLRNKLAKKDLLRAVLRSSA